MTTHSPNPIDRRGLISRLAARALGVVAACGVFWAAPGALAQSDSGAAATKPAPAKVSQSDQINPDQIPVEIRGLEYKENLGKTLPLDLEFTDASGKRVKLAKYFGAAPGGDGSSKPTLILMVYFRCPMQCPGIMQRLYARMNDLDLNVGEKYNVLVVSFDPTEDYLRAAEQRTIGRKSYARNLTDEHAASWEYLTDSGGNSRKLADALGFPYKYLPESNQYSHGTELFVVSPKGEISRYLYGLDFPTITLRLALIEASEGKIGSSVDRVILWCFHFDPHANSYVVQAFRVMQVGAVLSALMLSAVLGWMFILERRRRARTRAGVAGGRAGGSAGGLSGSMRAPSAAGGPQVVVVGQSG